MSGILDLSRRMVDWVITAFLGALLLSSSATKFQHPRQFQEITREYPWGRLWARVALAVPVFEGLAALLLFSFQDPFCRIGKWATLGFLLAATAGLAARRIRGERRFRCGCGPDPSHVQSASVLLVRNAALTAITAAALISSPTRLETRAPALQFYAVLAGCGLVLAARLVAAAWTARGAIEEWKASG